ncbi:MAG: ABC transporter substrate-binding protein [Selenomonadaceae bacterium]|nr:ABC transporter substrate-binding protein [Selenomonadaceae bacterium]
MAVLLLMALVLTGCGGGDKPADTNGKGDKNSANKLVIYTSMKESLIGGIVEGFKAKNPDIEVDWQSAGAGKIMAKLEAERQSGHLMADIIWTSEVPDFYQMKDEGLLEKYQPAGFDELLNPFDDDDGSFTAARLGTLGIVINVNKIQTDPAGWETIATDPLYKNSFGIADPALSGTAFMSIALLEKQFGWDYIVRLHDNGATKSKGSGRVIDDTADGALNACLGVDYITAGKIDKGSPLKMVYPKELLMVPSPVAIFKDAEHKDNAKKFVDYLMTQEAQQKVAEAGTVPVRRDIQMPERYNLPAPEDALNNGIKINYAEVLENKDDIVKKFSNLFK